MLSVIVEMVSYFLWIFVVLRHNLDELYKLFSYVEFEERGYVRYR